MGHVTNALFALVVHFTLHSSIRDQTRKARLTKCEHRTHTFRIQLVRTPDPSHHIMSAVTSPHSNAISTLSAFMEVLTSGRHYRINHPPAPAPGMIPASTQSLGCHLGSGEPPQRCSVRTPSETDPSILQSAQPPVEVRISGRTTS
jgi:hypothetical protein